jgi:hypothetical protein
MTMHLRDVLRHLLKSSLITAIGLLLAGAVNAAVIAPGAQTTNVPTALYDPLATLLTDPLPAGQFLLPIEISGVNGLQNWSFDLTFDDTVVMPLDAFGLYQWVYQAEFNAVDTTLSDIISSGLLLSGSLTGIAGFSSGVSGDGLLAFVLFEYLPDQEENDPNFGIDNPTVQQAPEPSTVFLLAAGLLILTWLQRARGAAQRTATR